MASARVGIVVCGSVLPAWQHRIVWELSQGERAALALVVELAGARARGTRGFVFRAYERIDQRLFGAPRDATTPVDATALLAPVPRRSARAVRRSEGWDLAPRDLEALRGAQIDVLIQLGGGTLAGAVLDAARLGVWTFAHDDDVRRGIAPLCAEVLRGDEVTETRLVARTGAGERVLYRSWAGTNPNSLARNRGAALWKSADFVARALRGFEEGREPPFDGGPTLERTAPAPRAPRARDVARFAAASVMRVARNRSRLRHHERIWFVAIRRRRAEPLVDDALDGFEPLSCPADRFHADPILVHHRGAHHLFFEDGDRASGLGAIAWRPIGTDGRAGESRIVMRADHHLSYPFVFEWRGAHFMIPETSEKGTIEIHRATEFPLRWQLEKVLFRDVVAVDSTVLEHGGRLWLFTAMSPGGGGLNDELFLFSAEHPLGDWTPHPANPIVSDVRRARPAGPLFWDAGALWRPGQDCAADYGAAFWLSRVDALDARSYRETPVRRIDASWTPGGVCTHTYARAGDFEVLDGRTWQPR
ncbi:MAG: hypothetical protein DCC71_04455 [Proteobacteria bacterium]|nr:MAG: hypothetical protein DCC71_04455 [Pseudomonadota bacterium]